MRPSLAQDMNLNAIDKLARQERTRREILNKSDLIPTLPDLVLRVIDLLNRGDAEPEDLETHIQYDQVLVAKLLGMVNSPFYGVSRKISTISDAIMVLGFRGLRSLVLASTTAQYLGRRFDIYGYSERGLWVHALATASACRTLAREARLGGSASEEMFVTGLLHDVGKMLVLPFLQEAGVQGITPGQSMQDLEMQVVGVDHTAAGALVCAKWNLGVEIQTIIKAHHGEDDAAEYAARLAVLRLSDSFAHEFGHGYEPDAAPEPVYRSQDLDTLKLDDASWEEARQRMEFHVDAAISSLESLCS